MTLLLIQLLSSWMLLPNTVVGEWWGKLLFVLFDLLAVSSQKGIICRFCYHGSYSHVVVKLALFSLLDLYVFPDE